MLQDVSEVLDVDDDVVLLRQLDIVEFIYLDCDGSMQGLLQDGSFKQSVTFPIVGNLKWFIHHLPPFWRLSP
jgi:hypothetical protein